MLEHILRNSLRGGTPLTVFLVAITAGLLALHFTAREEEPQIVVPMVDVLVEAPGLSPRQIERQVTIPLEKLLSQIRGVEHLYSSSHSGRAVVTLRFYVGEDREDAILNTYNKLYSNQHRIPPIVDAWRVQPMEVDDVPIVMLGLWSRDPQLYGDFELRRVAEELSTLLQGIARTSEVQVVGGRPRALQILINPESLAARQTTVTDLAQALQLSNHSAVAGQLSFNNRGIALEAGDLLRSVEELPQLVVNVVDGNPVYLRDVAQIVDGPAPADSYSWIDFAPRHLQHGAIDDSLPLVTISVAKQRGANAVAVAEAVHEKLARYRAELLPPEIGVEVLRDYGQTADDKVNNLVSSLGFAVLTVAVFIGVFLGWREALVVGLAVPICYGITLALDYLFGYTINRVTLFALILALGLLVDDPITGIDNIQRFLRQKGGERKDKIVAAMMEIRGALVMSTVTIVLAFVPLAFITGMMGPYMAPMAFNVPVSVIASTVVAFVVTPWLAGRLLKGEPGQHQDQAGPPPRRVAVYERLVAPLIASRARARWTLLVVLGLFVLTATLPLFRTVPLKLLPFDNKSEVQVVIDLPAGSALEQTAAVAREISARLQRLTEVQAVAAYVGEPSPMDFNALVRHYYQRHQSWQADLRLTLLPKDQREHQSHAVVLRMREALRDLQRYWSARGGNIQVVEVPPGPPVLSTLVVEVYGDELTDYATQQKAAEQVVARLEQEPHVVEIDSTTEAPHPRLRFITDKTKAALSGVATADIARTVAAANHGWTASHLQLPAESRPLPIILRLPQAQRALPADFYPLRVKARPGILQQDAGPRGGARGLDAAPQPLVPLGELGHFEEQTVEQSIFRKDLRPVVYVTAELNGRTPAEVIADVHADRVKPGTNVNTKGTDVSTKGTDVNTKDTDRALPDNYLLPGAGIPWSVPESIELNWAGEGEWRITVRVFRDMGLAFAFALVGIFFVLRLQTRSAALALIIMSAIPLTIIGIMPGFWLLNQFGERSIAGAPDPVLFTATAMIGMIALAGIVVRNSLILVEFITDARQRGRPLRAALIESGAVRMRPVLLTAGTTLLGNLIITLDPVFSGLALAIIFGIIASTLFTLLVIPVVYFLVFAERDEKNERDNTEVAST